MPIEAMFAITAVIFTGVGWWFGMQSGTHIVVDHTIEALIEGGFLKTRVKDDGETEIVKHDEN